MNTSEINSRSSAIFRYKMPTELVVRSQEDQNDYGVDFEIEERTKGTDGVHGRIFKIQLKGHERLQVINGGQIISNGGVKKDRLDYYLNKLNIPIAFVVCETTTELMYWEVLTGNPAAVDVLKRATSETCTLHIPASQKLPETINQMLAAIEVGRLWLSAVGVWGATERMFAKACEHVSADELKGIANELHAKAAILELSVIERKNAEGDYGSARSMIFQLINNNQTPSGTLLSAIVELDRSNAGLYLEGHSDRRSGLREVSAVINANASRIFTPGSGAVPWVYGLFYYRTIEAKLIGDSLLGLAMTIRNQGNLEAVGRIAFGLPISRLQFWDAQRNWQKAIGSSLNCIVRAANRGAMHLPIQILARTLIDAREGLIAIGMVDGKAASDRLAELMTSSVKVVAGLAVELQDWTGLEYLAVALTDFYDPAQPTWTRESVRDLLSSVECPVAVLDVIQSVLDSRHEKLESAAESSREKTASPNETREYYEDLATRLGIDLNDQDDDIARVVRIGIEDLNPERALKRCSEICVSLESNGLPAQMLDLPTAGSKRLTCIKHGKAIAGLSLDGISSTMAAMVCKGCPDAQPHPDGWHWTQDWQRDQEARLAVAKSSSSPESKRGTKQPPV